MEKIVVMPELLPPIFFGSWTSKYGNSSVEAGSFATRVCVEAELRVRDAATEAERRDQSYDEPSFRIASSPPLTDGPTWRGRTRRHRRRRSRAWRRCTCRRCRRPSRRTPGPPLGSSAGVNAASDTKSFRSMKSQPAAAVTGSSGPPTFTICAAPGNGVTPGYSGFSCFVERDELSLAEREPGRRGAARKRRLAHLGSRHTSARRPAGKERMLPDVRRSGRRRCCRAAGDRRPSSRRWSR